MDTLMLTGRIAPVLTDALNRRDTMYRDIPFILLVTVVVTASIMAALNLISNF